MRLRSRNCGDSFMPRPAACSVRSPVATSTDTMRECTPACKGSQRALNVSATSSS